MNQPELLHASVNVTNQLTAIKLTEEDGINVSEKLDETIQEYKLNEDQAKYRLNKWIKKKEQKQAINVILYL